MTIFLSNYKVRGVDISRWNDDLTTPKKPDLTKLVPTFMFCGVKVSQGTWKDMLFDYYWSSLKKINTPTMRIARFGYHFMDYGTANYQGKTPEYWGTAQAETCRGILAPDPGELDLHLDVESFVKWFNLSRLNADKPRRIKRAFMSRHDILTNKLTPIYTNPGTLWFFDEADKDRDLWLSWFNENITWMDVIKKLQAYKWRGAVHLLQYSSDGDYDEDGFADGRRFGMETDTLDLNVYPGTVEDFSKWVGSNMPSLPPVVTPPVPPESPPVAGSTKTISLLKVNSSSGLNIRNAPAIPSTVTGWLPDKKVVEVLEEVSQGANRWARVGQGQWCAIVYNGSTYLTV